MQLASSPAFPEPLLAAMWQLSENSRLGFQLAGSTVHQGFGAGKYLIAVGDTASVVRYAWLESLKAQQQKLGLFPTDVATDPGSVTVNWRLRTSDGKSKPDGNYLVFETLDHCGASGTVCQSNGTAIGPESSYKSGVVGYKDNGDVNVFRDGYGGTAGGNTIQKFTVQKMNGPNDLTYDPKRQIPVSIHYGGQEYGSQGIYHGPGGRAPVFVNGYQNIPSVPRISGEY